MGLQRGSHGIVAVVRVVHVFLVAGGKALAYALPVWSAMADGEVRWQRETGRGLTVGGVEEWMVVPCRFEAM